MHNKKEIAKRIEILKGLHEYFIEFGNEDMYCDWIECGVPDEPSEEDYNYIAENDDEFFEVLFHAEEVLRVNS